MTRRGDIVIVHFPFASSKDGKRRPALVIQSDRNNGRLDNTIVAMITSNVSHVLKEPTQLQIDPAKPSGKSSGLHGLSAIKCEHLLTIRQQDILRTIGHLPKAVMTQVGRCLKSSLGL